MITPTAQEIIAQHFIASREGLRLTAYRDSAGIPTIGYGHTAGVQMGATITREEAEKLLLDDLSSFETAVKSMVRVVLNDNQTSALVSFAFNVGKTALKNSTLLQYVNSRLFAKAADEFLKWDKITVGGQKVVSKGLQNRRAAERALFLQK